jgi:hypothetical protein
MRTWQLGLLGLLSEPHLRRPPGGHGSARPPAGAAAGQRPERDGGGARGCALRPPRPQPPQVVRAHVACSSRQRSGATVQMRRWVAQLWCSRFVYNWDLDAQSKKGFWAASFGFRRLAVNAGRPGSAGRCQVSVCAPPLPGPNKLCFW